MIIVLVGPPGAGKGTQADKLVAKNGFRKLSTGDALRKHIKNKTKIGEKAAAIMARGELVPDEILLGILQEELGSDANEVVLLDGYPRNAQQAVALKGLCGNKPIIGAVHLDVNSEELIDRLSGRRTCLSCSATFHVISNPPQVDGICDRCGDKLVQRPDDEKEKIKVRLAVYEDLTKPVLDFYRDENLYYRIDGKGDSEEIFRKLDVLVNSVVNNYMH